MKSYLYGVLLLIAITIAFAPVDISGAITPVNAQATIPTPIDDQLQQISQIALGAQHTCALTTTGEVTCWGINEVSQLGNNSTTPSGIPVRVAGLSNGTIQAIAAGEYHTCAVTTAGSVRCWGLHYGQPRHSRIPIDIPELGNDLRAITAGHSHTCALTTDGSAKCWGQHNSDGEPWPRLYSPPSPFVLISAGSSHTCALSENRKVYCWGSNASGQLGDGTDLPSSLLPSTVVGLDDDIQTISAGGEYTCAVTITGGVKCWGDNTHGQLGTGDTDGHRTAVEVVDLTGEVQAISTGTDHTCARMTTGAIHCWGDNQFGQLGDGTTERRLLPTEVIGLADEIVAIGAGNGHTCALSTSGTLQCWGRNSAGQLGNGSHGRSTLPIAVVSLDDAMVAVSSGREHACAVTTGGGVRCWGSNGAGQLGDGSTNNRLTPVSVTGLAGAVTTVGTGAAHSCALTQRGGVQCWGSNWAGQLGDGTTMDASTPVNVVGLETDVIAIRVGRSHTCALLSAGNVNCWGGNFFGQLGDGSRTDRTTPVDVIDLPDMVVAIGAGDSHTCVLTEAGAVSCWGKNEYGQLGRRGLDGTIPHVVNTLRDPVKAIAVGFDHTCALLTAGTVSCWGRNQWGQLGASSTTGGYLPVAVIGLGNDIRSISAGGDNSCAVTFSNTVYCWGDNWYGQLGYGELRYGDHSSRPSEIPALVGNVRDVSVGSYHTCAVTIAAEVSCWGRNSWGQLGDGTAWATTPVDVVAGFAHFVHLPIIMR